MKRDIKEILGSADAEKISEDYKVVDRKTSRRMFSSYLKKVGTANNQFSETTENSEIYKFENTHILRRIAALAAYGVAFVLLIGATVGIIKMKGPKNNKLNPSPQPEILATESQTETDNNSSVNPTDKKDEKIGKEKTTSHSASSVTKTDKDNNSPNTDTAINESEANNSSEPKTNDNPDKNNDQTTTQASENVEKSTSETKHSDLEVDKPITTVESISQTQAETTSTTTNVDNWQTSDVFNMLDSLNYHAISCDGLPTHKLTSPNGTVYYLHLDENASYSYVWRRPSLIAEADNEAPLTQKVIDTIYQNWDKLNIVEYHGI